MIMVTRVYAEESVTEEFKSVEMYAKYGKTTEKYSVQHKGSISIDAAPYIEFKVISKILCVITDMNFFKE
jgi:hypothetical protein